MGRNLIAWVSKTCGHGKPILEGSRQAQKRSRTQILTPSDPKISGKEPKTLSKRAHNPPPKQAGPTKPKAAHPSGGPVQYCSARDLRKGVWHDICAMSSCVPVKLPG